jgi:apolipoprotein N-acyltransferase
MQARPYLAALASAALMWAAYPPLDIGVLAFVAPIPLLAVLRIADRAWTAIGAGFLYGAVFFGALLSYVRVVGVVAWIPLTIWLAATAAAYALFVWSFRHWPPTRWWLITVGGWGLWELIRVTFPWGGFPWGVTGYAIGGVPGFVGATQWVGPSGWSILGVAVAAGAVLVLEDRANWRLVVDPSVVVFLLALGGLLLAPSADGQTASTAIIQGNSPCPQTHCQNENRRIYESHLALTRSLDPDEVDLVVWPENATGTPYDPVTNPEVDQALMDEAQRLGAYMIISGTRSVSETEFANVNMVYDPSGRRIGEYAKRHPVPFGEFVPLRGLLDFVPQLDRVPRDMVRGDGPVVFRTPAGQIGTVISFEGAFSRLVRSVVQEGADLMVVTTNNSTWGEAVASDQFIDITRVNAAAIGQDLVHAAITGKSAFITASGDVTATSGLLTTEILMGESQFRTAGPTLFTRLGDWVLLVALAAGVAAVLTPGEGRPQRRSKQTAAVG